MLCSGSLKACFLGFGILILRSPPLPFLVNLCESQMRYNQEILLAFYSMLLILLAYYLREGRMTQPTSLRAEAQRCPSHLGGRKKLRVAFVFWGQNTSQLDCQDTELVSELGHWFSGMKWTLQEWQVRGLIVPSLLFPLPFPPLICFFLVGPLTQWSFQR